MFRDSTKNETLLIRSLLSITILFFNGKSVLRNASKNENSLYFQWNARKVHFILDAMQNLM
jgi:hypothetical protein